MLIYDNSQISKNALDYKMINVNKIDYISKDYRNNKDNIRSDIEL